MSLRVGGRAARHSYLPGLRRGGGSRQAGVTVLSCLMCQCELDNCSGRVQTSNFLSATVLHCRESNSHRWSGRDTDKTVLSCLAWRCELSLTVAWWHSGYGVELTIKWSRVQISVVPLSSNNLGQVVHTHARVLLLPSSIIWYCSKGGDALRLGR